MQFEIERNATNRILVLDLFPEIVESQHKAQQNSNERTVPTLFGVLDRDVDGVDLELAVSDEPMTSLLYAPLVL